MDEKRLGVGTGIQKGVIILTHPLELLFAHQGPQNSPIKALGPFK